MKNALVLGASGSLGKEISSALIKKGYHVIGSYYNQIKIEDKNVKFYPLDMGSIESIDNFIDKLKDIKQIDFFTSTIANTLTLERFEKIELETFKKDFEINFFNYIYFIRKILNKMTDKSVIVMILSQMIIEPQKNFSPYITSKYALLGLMHCLAKELELKKIRINAVSPSKMDTNFLWKMDMNGKTVSVPKAIREKQLMTQNFLLPEKVAKKIVEIIEDESINNENMLVQ